MCWRETVCWWHLRVVALRRETLCPFSFMMAISLCPALRKCPYLDRYMGDGETSTTVDWAINSYSICGGLCFSLYSVMLLKCCCVFMVVFGLFIISWDLNILWFLSTNIFPTCVCVKMVFLSEERVSFGDIPVCSRSTRILFLTNVSHTERVLYSWKLKEQDGKQVCEMGTTHIYVLHVLQCADPLRPPKVTYNKVKYNRSKYCMYVWLFLTCIS